MYVRNLMLFLPRASDTDARYSLPRVNETVIYRCYKSLGCVPATALNCVLVVILYPLHVPGTHACKMSLVCE